jgi:glycosyltransferase involved in cell wall biosynthesis
MYDPTSPKKKIAVVTNIVKDFNFFRGQIGFLKSKGFEFFGISSPGDPQKYISKGDQFQFIGIDIIRGISPIRDVRAIVKLWRIFRQIRPDIVHAGTPKGALIGILSATLAKVPVKIYYVRGLRLLTETGWRERILFLSEKLLCWLAELIICDSESVRQQILIEGLCNPKKLKVLLKGSCNGVDARERFNPTHLVKSEVRRKISKDLDLTNSFIIGVAGRFVRDKGILEVLCSWKILRKEFADLYLLMIGEFEPNDPLSSTVKQYFLSDSRVLFPGWLDNVELGYKAMDVFVLPSYREGFPNVLLEAAAMELPVVATKVTGCVDAVEDGVTGILVPPYNIDALVAAVRKYLMNPDLRIRHGRSARNRVLKYFRPEEVWYAQYEQYMILLNEKCNTNY